MSDAPASAAAAHAAPDRLPPCDLVLRGGITSGVVYPGAVAELGRRFRFVSIGGASAGAIAAGVTAAAEFGRQAGGVPDAFARVDDLADDIAGSGRMRRLFRAGPHRALQMLGAALWTVLGLPGKKGLWAVAALLLMAALLTLAASLVAASLGLGLGGAALVQFLAIIALGASLWLGLRRFAGRVLPEAGFGLCGGIHPGLNADEVTQTSEMLREEGALMDWLHATVQGLAGRSVGQVPARGSPNDLTPKDRPLTMSDLWGGGATDTRRIDLLLTTTNVSQQLGHHFPFLERTGAALYFDPAELRRVLPRDVVRWMVLAARHPNSRVARSCPHLLRLPEPADLPVILGVRLSLSFPGLIAAVPLHAEDWLFRKTADETPGASTDEPARPRRCWFSDGGITSNFPIHVFDGPLPRRPTFCINLREATAAEARDPGRLVYMAQRNHSDMRPRFLSKDDHTLAGFLSAIVTTARNAHENEMMLTPGHRDRIAHVLTTDGEGGLNLGMDATVIEGLSARGAEAARRIIDRFHPGGSEPDRSEMGWHNQRWIRLRTLLAAQERMLADIAAALRHRDPSWGDYTGLRRRMNPNGSANKSGKAGKGRRPVPSYPWRDAQTAEEAGRAMIHAMILSRRLRRRARAAGPMPGSGSVFDGYIGPGGQRRHGAPRPKGGLRMRPIGSDPRAEATYPGPVLPAVSATTPVPPATPAPAPPPRPSSGPS
jgi:predicted acylesterase/phospholipase RssA